RQLAVILATNVDDTSLLARYGGEEFAILLPDSSRERAVEVAEKLRSVVGQHNFEITLRTDDGKVYTKSLGATISMGVACYPDHCTDKDGLIKAADIALYQAKRSGRDCIRVYDGNMDTNRTDANLLHTLVSHRGNCTLELVAAAIDARDHYTVEHSWNVRKYSLMIGRWLGLAEKEIELLGKAAALHDVGKIGVPDQVLNKPSDLNETEMSIVRTHCVIGEAIVRNSDDNQAILPGIRSHHERFDGKGYPDGLAGKSIPLIARIIAVADTYDALTSDRPHRRAYNADQALEILRSCAGSQLDPEIVDVFSQAIRACTESIKKHAA
ncbi:MAG: diguanylate cyclase, partial [Armatimonadota bacterium]